MVSQLRPEPMLQILIICFLRVRREHKHSMTMAIVRSLPVVVVQIRKTRAGEVTNVEG
jgi:hypothetical protein